MFYSTVALALAAFHLPLASSQPYQLIQEYTPENFFEEFGFYNGQDPTSGFVQYVPRDTAVFTGLVGNASDLVYLGVDTTNVYPVSGPGRPSVRLESKMTFTEGLFVLDLTHMPIGCGTWPAFWTVGLGDWPTDGEIDIIENVNDEHVNSAALHAAGDCSVSRAVNHTSIWKSTDCNIAHDENQGCGTEFTEPSNYGAEFNANGGGVYAMEWTSQNISVWFFPPNAVPASISSSISSLSVSSPPNTSDFGTPSASFSGPCSPSFANKFFNHTIVIDTTFCGGWSGSTFGTGSSQCIRKANITSQDSCIDYVANNPQAFEDAWWGIKSLKVWQKVSDFASTSDTSQTVPDLPDPSVIDILPFEEDFSEPEPTFDISPLIGGVVTMDEDLAETEPTAPPEPDIDEWFGVVPIEYVEDEESPSEVSVVDPWLGSLASGVDNPSAARPQPNPYLSDDSVLNEKYMDTFTPNLGMNKPNDLPASMLGISPASSSTLNIVFSIETFTIPPVMPTPSPSIPPSAAGAGGLPGQSPRTESPAPISPTSSSAPEILPSEFPEPPLLQGPDTPSIQSEDTTQAIENVLSLLDENVIDLLISFLSSVLKMPEEGTTSRFALFEDMDGNTVGTPTSGSWEELLSSFVASTREELDSLIPLFKNILKDSANRVLATDTFLPSAKQTWTSMDVGDKANIVHWLSDGEKPTMNAQPLIGRLSYAITETNALSGPVGDMLFTDYILPPMIESVGTATSLHSSSDLGPVAEALKERFGSLGSTMKSMVLGVLMNSSTEDPAALKSKRQVVDWDDEEAPSESCDSSYEEYPDDNSDDPDYLVETPEYSEGDKSDYPEYPEQEADYSQAAGYEPDDGFGEEEMRDLLHTALTALLQNVDPVLVLKEIFSLLGLYTWPDTEDQDPYLRTKRQSPVFTNPEALVQEFIEQYHTIGQSLSQINRDKLTELAAFTENSNIQIGTKPHLEGYADKMKNFVLKYYMLSQTFEDLSEEDKQEITALLADGKQTSSRPQPPPLAPKAKRDTTAATQNYPYPSKHLSRFRLHTRQTSSDDYYPPTTGGGSTDLDEILGEGGTLDPMGMLGVQSMQPGIEADDEECLDCEPASALNGHLDEDSVDEASPELEALGTLDPMGMLGPQGVDGDDIADGVATGLGGAHPDVRGGGGANKRPKKLPGAVAEVLAMDEEQNRKDGSSSNRPSGEVVADYEDIDDFWEKWWGVVGGGIGKIPAHVDKNAGSAMRGDGRRRDHGMRNGWRGNVRGRVY